MKIAFYPDKPLGHKINSVIGYLKWDIVDYKDTDTVFWWNCSCYYNPIPDFLKDKRIINTNALDTTKQFIEEYFETDTFIDPETYKGEAIKKYEVNMAPRNIDVVNCPTDKENGYVYQRILEQKEEHYFDYRICWVFGRIPIVFKKYKRTMLPDGGNEEIVKIEITDMSVFSEAFQVSFWDKMFGWCDYAEVDVLQEKVIDVNLTPSAAMFLYIDKEDYIKKVGEIFKDVFES